MGVRRSLISSLPVCVGGAPPHRGQERTRARGWRRRRRRWRWRAGENQYRDRERARAPQSARKPRLGAIARGSAQCASAAPRGTHSLLVLNSSTSSIQSSRRPVVLLLSTILTLCAQPRERERVCVCVRGRVREREISRAGVRNEIAPLYVYRAPDSIGPRARARYVIGEEDDAAGPRPSLSPFSPSLSLSLSRKRSRARHPVGGGGGAGLARDPTTTEDRCELTLMLSLLSCCLYVPFFSHLCVYVHLPACMFYTLMCDFSQMLIDIPAVYIICICRMCSPARMVPSLLSTLSHPCIVAACCCCRYCLRYIFFFFHFWLK